MQLDAYINDQHGRTCKNLSDQGQSMSCYAHATAAVLHMALLRIIGCEGGCPSIEEIPERILNEFRPRPNGHSVKKVLKAALLWYGPLHFRKTDEEGARHAVLHRRPVLTTFHLSNSGWDIFSQHFGSRGLIAFGDRTSRVPASEAGLFRSALGKARSGSVPPRPTSRRRARCCLSLAG